MGKQMQVREYLTVINPLYRKEFMRLMRDWDGRADVGSAFYDIDVLNMKAKEAREAVEG